LRRIVHTMRGHHEPHPAPNPHDLGRSYFPS
jgi:hypothetical protein